MTRLDDAIQSRKAVDSAEHDHSRAVDSARKEFEAFETRVATELAQSATEAIDQLKANGIPTSLYAVSQNPFRRYVKGWSNGRYFVMTAKGVIFAGGTAQKLNRFNPLDWATSEVKASRQKRYSVRDSYFDDSPYAAAFIKGDLSQIDAARSEVKQNQHSAMVAIADLVVNNPAK